MSRAISTETRAHSYQQRRGVTLADVAIMSREAAESRRVLKKSSSPFCSALLSLSEVSRCIVWVEAEDARAALGITTMYYVAAPAQGK